MASCLSDARGWVYLHLEKTGGTAVSAALVDAGLARTISPVRGHVRAPALSWLNIYPAEVLCTVRSPWRWYASLLRYWRGKGEYGRLRLAPYIRAAGDREDDASLIRAMADGGGTFWGTSPYTDRPPIGLATWLYLATVCGQGEFGIPVSGDIEGLRRYHAEHGLLTLAIHAHRLEGGLLAALDACGQTTSETALSIIHARLGAGLAVTGGGDDLAVYRERPDLAELVLRRDALLCELFGFGWDFGEGKPIEPPESWLRMRPPLRERPEPTRILRPGVKGGSECT